MKKWKKLVALALAAILAMSLLTACGGGGGGSSLGSQIESTIINGVNSARSVGKPTLSNDSTLRSKCAENLNQIKDGKVAAKYVVDIAPGGSVSSGVITLMVLEMPIKEDELPDDPNALVTPKEVNIDYAKTYMKEMTSVTEESDQEFLDSISAIGVATRTIGDKVYMAVAVTLELTDE